MKDSITVTEAMISRRAVRAFTPRPVSREQLRALLEIAQRAPSGGNVQPWEATVVTGEALERVKRAVAKQAFSGSEPDYQIYPSPLPEPWRTRRYEVGEDMYGALSIGRGDKAARMAQLSRNFVAFDAPLVMFVHCNRIMGPPQWADMGIWLQSVMLLLQEAGLDSCPQEAWSNFGATVRHAIGLDDDAILYAGLAIGYRDEGAAINNFPVKRAALDKVIRWLDG